MKLMVKQIESSMLKKDLPVFKAGDTVRVHVKIKEGDKERIQAFQGLVIAKRYDSLREMIVVRKISNGIGVERIFPVHSPIVDKIEVVSKGMVRRAKLYYLRSLRGKKSRIQEERRASAETASQE